MMITALASAIRARSPERGGWTPLPLSKLVPALCNRHAATYRRNPLAAQGMEAAIDVHNLSGCRRKPVRH